MAEISLYTDPEAEILKEEIGALQIEIELLCEQIADAEKLIHDFGMRQSRELGDILRELLKVKKDKLKREQNGTETRRREFEQAQQDFEQYNQQYEEDIAAEQFELSDEEKHELKCKYRKATKLCHPDLVSDELNEQAEVIFKELQKAYEQNNLDKVTEILELLEKGEMLIHKTEDINEIKILKAKAINLENKMTKLKQELIEIKRTESYQSIIEIKNWDEYFEIAKARLIYELQTLKTS